MLNCCRNRCSVRGAGPGLDEPTWLPAAGPGSSLGAPRGSKGTQRANHQGCKKSRGASQKIGRNQQLFSTPIPGVGWGNSPAPLQQFWLPPAAADRGGQLDPGLCWVKLGRIVPEGLSRKPWAQTSIARASPKAGVPAMLRFTPLGPRSVGHARRRCPQEGKKALSSPLPRHGRSTCCVGFRSAASQISA